VPTTSDESTMPGQRCMPKLTFDPEWLAILRAFHPFFSMRRHQPDYPDEATAPTKVAKEMESLNVRNNETSSSDAPLPGFWSILDCQTFVQNAPGPRSEGAQKNQQHEYTNSSKYLHWHWFAAPWYTNPQTAAFVICLTFKTWLISLLTIGPKKPLDSILQKYVSAKGCSIHSVCIHLRAEFGCSSYLSLKRPSVNYFQSQRRPDMSHSQSLC